MFLETQRMTGHGGLIKIIEPAKYLEFFAELKNMEMNIEFKVFLAVAVSGGCRVTETLRLTAEDFHQDGSFRVTVLKKRTEIPIKRPCMLCPDARELVLQYLVTRSLKGSDKLFTMHRATVHRRVKKYFGPNACSHSIARHSHISWLLHEQGIPSSSVAAEMAMLSHVVDAYSHANVSLRQAERFRK